MHMSFCCSLNLVLNVSKVIVYGNILLVLLQTHMFLIEQIFNPVCPNIVVSW